MALNAATVWEIRTGGTQTNGGGFYNRTPGTSVDYSQQNAAQLTVTDLGVVGTAISSVTGGFTAAMVGNIVYITGGGATAGWYEMTARADGNNATIDRTAGAGTNSTINVGGAFAFGGALDGDFVAQVIDGNDVHIGPGTHTLGEAITFPAGGAAARQRWMGYNTSRGDDPTGANRPTIACGAFIATGALLNDVYNLIFTGTAADVFISAGSSHIVNCKSTNSSGSGNRSAFSASGGRPQFVKCESISTNGYGFNTTAAAFAAFQCYAHDSVQGYVLLDNCDVIGSFADTCSGTGILLNATSVNDCLVANNTVYGCAVGIGGSGVGNVIVNNILDGNTTDLSWGALGNANTNLIDYNCLNGTTKRTNVAAGAHDVDSDPLLVDPANGDFSLDTSSPCFDAGMQPDSTIGIV